MPSRAKRTPTGWDHMASWYDAWMGRRGGAYHRRLAIPALMRLLEPQRGQRILDVGAGQGVLAPRILARGADYVGVEVSPRLVALARRRHGPNVRILRGDARHLQELPGLQAASFDGVVFLLAVQDMDPLEEVIASAAWALRPSGRLVLVMTHPCFRVPRQSGWIDDESQRLRYRRVARYLTPLPVPLRPYGPSESGISISFHRPLSHYVNAMGDEGLAIDRMEEIPTFEEGGSRSERRANAEIPLFLALRAIKYMPCRERVSDEP